MPFELVRELASVERDKGEKRLLLALYSTETAESGIRYIALSEQNKSGEEWVSARKGITIRRLEREAVITALQSADFDAKPDNKNLSNAEYAKLLTW